MIFVKSLWDFKSIFINLALAKHLQFVQLPKEKATIIV